MNTFEDALQQIIPHATGVEVGVMYGRHCMHLLDSVPDISIIYAVDPYLPYHDDTGPSDNGRGAYTSGDVATWKEHAIYNLAPYCNRVVHVYERSVDGPSAVSGTVDFVYIDACHKREAVDNDIAAWYPVLRVGGLFGGHDIRWKGVSGAVSEFASTYGLEVTRTRDEWWVVKS